MNKLLISALLFFCVTVVQAQDWYTDFNEASAAAKSKHLPIIMVFQGSDWCAPCIKLSREVWESSDFISYAPTHYIMMQVDFPRQKKNALSPEMQSQNDALAGKYNPNGYFPFVVILDENGKVLGETGYKKMTPEAYIAHLSSFIN